MAQIAVEPIVMTNAILEIGSGTADTFEKHVSKAEMVPTASPVTWKGLGGNSHSKTPTATWALNLDYAQDWVTAKSLSRYLFENEGAVVPFKLRPVAGGPGFSGKISITPGAIGGAVDSTAVASVTLGMDGKPAAIAAA